MVSRASIGTAALEAQDRFHVDAAMLSTLAVAQLAVYALMQVPVGILLDRFGSKRLLIAGATVIAAGQLIVALSLEISAAVVGRMLVGFGDAFIFISVTRLVNGWYEGKTATRLQQLVTNVGQLGQAASAIPFAYLLHLVGWSQAFSFLAVLLAFVASLSWWLISNDRPSKQIHQRASSLKVATTALRKNFRQPGVWLAFWTHFSVQSASSIFLLLWGMPFLVKAQGISQVQAASMLASVVIVGFAAGPAIGSFCVRWPKARHKLVLAVMLTVAIVLGSILLQPNSSPTWLLWLLCVVLGISSPTAMVAFDYSRSFVSKSELGAVNGFVNIGGFSATFAMMFIAGLVLDVVMRISGQGLFSIIGFRFALLVELVTLSLGAVFILKFQRRLKASLNAPA